MCEEILRYNSPAGLILAVLAWLMLYGGHYFLLESHYRRRGIKRWKSRPVGLAVLHFNAKEWAIWTSLGPATGVLIVMAVIAWHYAVHLVF